MWTDFASRALYGFGNSAWLHKIDAVEHLLRWYSTVGGQVICIVENFCYTAEKSEFLCHGEFLYFGIWLHFTSEDFFVCLCPVVLKFCNYLFLWKYFPQNILFLTKHHFCNGKPFLTDKFQTPHHMVETHGLISTKFHRTTVCRRDFYSLC